MIDINDFFVILVIVGLLELYEIGREGFVVILR